MGITLGRSLAMAAGKAKSIPIGFQLYTVRGEFARNVPETLKTLAQIGYQAVEWMVPAFQEHLARCGGKRPPTNVDPPALARLLGLRRKRPRDALDHGLEPDVASCPLESWRR